MSERTNLLMILAGGLMLLGLTGSAGGASSAAWTVGGLILTGLVVRWAWRKTERWAYREPQDGER